MRRALLGLLAVCAVACQARAPASTASGANSGGREPESNILRSDYAGSKACLGCHAGIAEGWARSAMHRMTRDAATAQMEAPFDGRELRLGADTASLELREGSRFMKLLRGDQLSLFRVTKVIGGRYREDFVGAEVPLQEPFGVAVDDERVLPLSYLRFDGTLRYKGYSVMVPERSGLEPGLVWQRACIMCHNTTPTFTTLYDDLYGPGAPSYQGSASVELPENKAFRYVVDDAGGLRAALTGELRQLGVQGNLSGDVEHALSTTISQTRERWGEAQLLELGVGCESCHGGALEHVRAPLQVLPSFALRSRFMHVEAASGGPPTPAQDVNRTCAKCHTVLFSQYPYTWEGGERRRAPGSSTTNSGEARDFLLGGCASAMDCTSCHDPHGGDSAGHLEQLGQVQGNRICTGCHAELAAPSALQAHSHHAPGQPGSACLGCHMPKKNMGLAYDFTRSHRIGSPTDPERVLGDRPLECALCHANRSVEQIVLTMEKWWGKRYDRGQLRRLYGADLGLNPVWLTLLAGKPHEQALAADIAVRKAVPKTDALIGRLLGNDYPLVRYFARHSLERRFGAKLPLDMNLPGPDLERAAAAWMASRPPM